MDDPGPAPLKTAAAGGKRRRRGPIAGAAGAAFMLAVVSGVWVWGTSRMAAELARWGDQQRAQGRIVAYDAPVRAGWPLAWAIVLRHVTWGVTGSGGDWSAQADDLRLTVRPWAPAMLELTTSGLRLGSAGVTMQFAASRLLATVALDGTGFAATADDMTATIDAPGATAGPVTLAHGQLTASAVDGKASLAGLTLAGEGLPYGGRIDAARAAVTLNAAVPPLGSPAQALAAWRDAGGVATIQSAAIDAGPLHAAATAAIRLDAQLQPVVAGTMHLTGYTEAIEALSRVGVISRAEQRVALTLLGLVAVTGPDGVTSVDLPVSVMDGRLSAGAIPLAFVPRLSFP